MKKHSGDMGKSGRYWIRAKGWLAAGAATITVGATVSPVWAMGQGISPGQTGGAVMPPNTVTVVGVSTQPVLHPVKVVAYSATVSDSTSTEVARDLQTLRDHLFSALRREGLPAGDLMFSLTSFNSSSNTNPTASLQSNIVVANAPMMHKVLYSLDAYQPTFLSNSFTNISIVPLNPAAMWPAMYRAALVNARSQAQSLAREAGEKLGPVVSMSTLTAPGVPPTVLYGPYPTSPTVTGMQVQYGINGGSPTAVTTEITVTYALVAG